MSGETGFPLEFHETTMSSELWIPAVDWTGPAAVLYHIFDSTDRFILMESTEEKGPVPIVDGQVIWIKTERNKRIYVLVKIIPLMFDGFPRRGVTDHHHRKSAMGVYFIETAFV